MYRCFFILITLLYKYNFFPMISLSLSFSVFSSSLSFYKPKEHSYGHAKYWVVNRVQYRLCASGEWVNTCTKPPQPHIQ